MFVFVLTSFCVAFLRLRAASSGHGRLHVLGCRNNPEIGEGAKGELRVAMEPLLRMPCTSELYFWALLI